MTLHVLIVDPDRSASQVTCATIKHLAPDTVCTIAADPVQGWLRLRQQPADVLVIDPARYPQVGQRLLQLAGETLPQMQVIVLSSSIVPLARQLPGVAAYLEKNLSPGMLRIKLRALLQRVIAANEPVAGNTAGESRDPAPSDIPDAPARPLDQAA